jgi:hypothetical protein
MLLVMCSDGDGSEAEPVSRAGATGRGGAGLGGSAGAHGGALPEGGTEQGGEPSTEPTYAGGTSLPVAGGGAGGDGGAAGSAPASDWLRECEPETCPQSFPSCVLMSVAEGAPSEKLCTFLCDTPVGFEYPLDPAKVAACEDLGGVCTGGGDVRAYCGPVI